MVENLKDRPEGGKQLPGPGELLILTDASSKQVLLVSNDSTTVVIKFTD